MKSEITISPKYVWLTSGTGEYWNQGTAMCMAKRSAGLEHMFYIPVLNIENTPFKLLDRKEFLEKSEKNSSIYSYGTIQYGKLGDRLMGSISAISTESWGGISYNFRCGKPSSNPPVRSEISSIRQVISDYERMVDQQSPKPVTISSDTSCNEDKDYSLIVVAMIIGDIKNA